MRAGRSTSGTAYNYVYNGSQLTQMTVGNYTLQFRYSATGAPMAVICNGTYYYYITNIQGFVHWFALCVAESFWNSASCLVALAKLVTINAQSDCCTEWLESQ